MSTVHDGLHGRPLVLRRRLVLLALLLSFFLGSFSVLRQLHRAYSSFDVDEFDHLVRLEGERKQSTRATSPGQGDVDLFETNQVSNRINQRRNVRPPPELSWEGKNEAKGRAGRVNAAVSLPIYGKRDSIESARIITSSREFWLGSFSKSELKELSSIPRQIEYDPDDLIRLDRVLKDNSNDNLPNEGGRKKKKDCGVKCKEAKQEVVDEKTCVPLEDWQTRSYPQCNMIHELDMSALSFVTSGGSNDIYRVSSSNNKFELMDLAYKFMSKSRQYRSLIPPAEVYNDRNRGVVNRDALISSKLSASPYALDIVGYCGLVTLVPFADGVLSDEIKNSWKETTLFNRLKWATEAAHGVAALHSIKAGGFSPSAIHGDLTINQFFIRDGRLQIGDYNLGLLLRRNTTSEANETCTFVLPNHFSTTASPEEYADLRQTAAIDVWALGSVIHHIMYGEKVWSRHRKSKARELILEGQLPTKNGEFEDEAEINLVLLEARNMCYVFDPEQRPSAHEVAQYLEAQLRSFSDET